MSEKQCVNKMEITIKRKPKKKQKRNSGTEKVQ